MSGYQWFRMYAEAVDDDKLRLLAFEDRWHYVAILCCKAKGLLDPSDEFMREKVRIKLGLASDEFDKAIGRLARVKLIDAQTFEPRGWANRQFESDSSNERVKRHREKRAAAGLRKQTQIPRKVRDTIFAAFGYKCVYCESGFDLTIDHKTPEFRGGSNEVENLQVACRQCNASKRDLTDEEFKERISNDDVTLLKRPQKKNTESESESDKDRESANSAKQARATRLPASFPDAEALEWCRQERPELAAAAVADKFRDYWVGIPGARGRKLDWMATWRNFVRTERAPIRASPAASKRADVLAGLTGRSTIQAEVVDVAATVRRIS